MGMLTRNFDHGMFPETAMQDLMRSFFGDEPVNFAHEWNFRGPESRMKVRVHEQDVTVELPCAGCKRTDFEIETSRDFVTVKVAKREALACGENMRKTCSERSYAEFQESVKLPVNVLSQDAKAKYTDGVLTITIPREEAKKNTPKQIVVE